MKKKRINATIEPKLHDKAKKDSVVMFGRENVSKLLEILIKKNKPSPNETY